MKKEADVIIVGCGVAGLYCALNLPEDKRILLITKSSSEMSDSYLAQGGICVLKEEGDYESFILDTLKAGHFENSMAAVEQMVQKSPEVIRDLMSFGVEFEQKEGKLLYTREGAHSLPRILYHKDITGEEITSKLLARVKEKKNVTVMEHTEMIDLICGGNRCCGIIVRTKEGLPLRLDADFTVLATGGIGGLYKDSTNYPHLTGDALAIALRHKINLKNLNYIQIHPTTLYSEKPGRRFLISESVRGEGAYLLNGRKERFAEELLPRDILTQKILQQMEKEGSSYVGLSLTHLGREKILERFPNIYKRCLEEGIDITKDLIPVTPAQHYFMGGIEVDLSSRTSMKNLYAAGETSCNGVHGANRLASNSLLESLVFAKEAATDIAKSRREELPSVALDLTRYKDYEKLKEKNKELVIREIERAEQNAQRNNLQVKYG